MNVEVRSRQEAAQIFVTKDFLHSSILSECADCPSGSTTRDSQMRMMSNQCMLLIGMALYYEDILFYKCTVTTCLIRSASEKEPPQLRGLYRFPAQIEKMKIQLAYS